MTGLQRQLAPHNRYLRDLLAEGYVGRLRSPRLHVSMNFFQPRLPNALSWTVPPENFSSMVAIYVGHFLDMLFEAISWPTCVSERHPRPSRYPSPEQAKSRTMPADDRLRFDDHQGIQNARRYPRLVKTRRSKLLKASRFGAFLRSTLSWWHSVRISASSEARDRKRPMATAQIRLSMSPINPKQLTINN
jgi:hypothetical protein